jgi:hypothetical protein
MLHCIAWFIDLELQIILVCDLLGLTHLLSAFSKLGSSLTTLKLSHAALGARGINKLAETLLNEAGFLKSLQCLDLSDNSTRGDDITVSKSCASSVDYYVYRGSQLFNLLIC